MMPLGFVTFTASLIDDEGRLFGAIGWVAPPSVKLPAFVHLPANFVQGDPETMPVLDDSPVTADVNATTFVRTIVVTLDQGSTELLYTRVDTCVS